MTYMTYFYTKNILKESTLNYNFDEINQIKIFFHNIPLKASRFSLQPKTSENTYIIYFLYFFLGISYIR